ncbi:hypothetical protein RhiirA5_496104 [Rhizophagus irregularis]|uniref:Uncharacterized protein n=2 Tax=Rhizophagus irregularis TaxID=588596 RepID=A0A2N0RKG9_9GLOM|nr:hypothetical protein GLOIN_2v1607838 [Rhizophagus irregularis DAOM 181602=DAOM 197198]PKC13484.1 hypothetical protein RhiirA5_496104 [Rhizophagus irregularis]PKC63810.1 hypothetical protein RhiirA1_463255 [Rhizophagus irregularis]POG71225.1 hypothetical protein GLOIN_2v1607838 [Rhizophagus irregularis DAOM 181602=DAOM 197198]UZO24492.1 hypothetical protein OCT59_016789 [Rhizophagus irregularis]CAB4397798.1 unnamed protein product [Rhizophagus irregularis]|eukprot:XP_025178091.1 hypothetical protein GLOIN_2v1607838 [Rhizophagus irregularis DAOM 181602=DAOM 197198]
MQEYYHASHITQPFNYVFEYGLFILIMIIFYSTLDLSKLKLKHYGFPQHVTGNEKWTTDFIYPNHWKNGSIVEVSHKIGQDNQTRIIIPTSKIFFLLGYVFMFFILSWMWEPVTKNIECVKTSSTPELY